MVNKKSIRTMTIIMALLLLIFALVACTAKDTNKSSNGVVVSPSDTAKTTETSNSGKTETTPVEKYTDGVYLVGEDIKPGLYKVIVTDQMMGMGYVERSKSVDMSFDSILANIILTGDGYVEIIKTDKAVKLTGVEIYKVDIKKIKKDIKTEVHDGIYLVGYDIKPGTYKVTVTDEATGMGYVERTKRVSMNMKDIIANSIFQGPGYITVKKTDFAIRVQGAKLTFKK